MTDSITIRKTAIPSKLLTHIETRTNKGENRTKIIVDLMDKGLSSLSEQEKPSSSSLPVERGKSIETHQQVRRHEHVLLPCPSSGKWADRKLDCEPCTLKKRCRVIKFEHYFLEGITLHTHS